MFVLVIVNLPLCYAENVGVKSTQHKLTFVLDLDLSSFHTTDRIVLTNALLIAEMSIHMRHMAQDHVLPLSCPAIVKEPLWYHT